MDLDDSDAEKVIEAIEEGRRRAVMVHKQAGQPIVVWQDGRVVIVPPEDIGE